VGNRVFSRFGMAAWRVREQLSLTMVASVLVWSQAASPGPPAPPNPPGPPPARRIADLRQRLSSTKPVDITAGRAIDYGRAFLSSAEMALRARQTFRADRFAEAADALLHVAEHQQHLREGGAAKGPPAAAEIADHLSRTYFRTKQADYFLDEAHDSRAAAFPQWARSFYQLAVRAYERKDLLAADENLKCAEEIVRALESLAQAATASETPTPPPPPPPPRGEP